MLSCIQQEQKWDTTTATSFAPTALVFILLIDIAIFFIYLLIIYPACPARDEKSDDPPARVVAFSFVCGCPLGWDAPECPPLCSGYADDPYFASIIGKTVTQITFYTADGVYVLPVSVAL